VTPIPIPYPYPDRAALEKLDKAESDIALLRESVANLQERVVKQALLLRAFFSLFNEKGVLTETELLERFRQVKAETEATPAKMCSRCGRAVNLRNHRCFYCDEQQSVASAFDLL
jgi:hypothetical protein